MAAAASLVEVARAVERAVREVARAEEQEAAAVRARPAEQRVAREVPLAERAREEELEGGTAAVKARAVA